MACWERGVWDGVWGERRGGEILWWRVCFGGFFGRDWVGGWLGGWVVGWLGGYSWVEGGERDGRWMGGWLGGYGWVGGRGTVGG